MSISRAIGFISGINECVSLFQWTASSISSLRSRWSATQERNIQDEVSHLQRGLQRLRDTLPGMYGLIDRAEWKSHKPCVAELLPILKDAVYDADDILDEFRWHELDVAGEGNATHSAFDGFYKTTIQGSFNKVNDIQERLNEISSKLNEIGLHEVTPGFDRSVRPETISLPSERKIFGRDKDLKQVMGLLGVPPNKRGGRPKRKRESSTVNASTSRPASNQVSNESRVQAIPVLPIVGMGGIGKTTLAQHICNHPQVKSYFDLIIWICADDFDVKRLTKDAIESSSGKEAKLDHLDSLQRALSKNLSNTRFLIVIDDVWDDALKENGQRWKKFCAPFRNVVHGSMMIVTTRSPTVADGVRTMEPVPLQGLTNDVLWDFFKLCAFGSVTSENSPDLERIGRSILPKLKGSPLAAITLGRLLRMNLETSHWENILQSELWELKQEETDILPALRLSYMYLPPNLKRCFSFCAVYPKDHKFNKDRLAEIWVAEGFVEPQGDTPLKDIAFQYFQDLFNRSLFQKVAGSYVIHDLLHDMAQLVSVHDCFIIKSVGDFKNVPQNVRHLYILPNRDFDSSHLVSLSKHTKLRTLLCKFYMKKNIVDSVIGSWLGELRRMRVLLCASINKLPDSVGNLKHLRYLEITRTCPLKSLPPEFCCLHNLQRFYAEKCNIDIFPNELNKLISLQSFKSIEFQDFSTCKLELDAANGHGPGIKWIKNMNQISELRIHNLDAVCKDEAAAAKLKNKKYLHMLKLDWSSSNSLSLQTHNETEVFEVLQPPTSLEHLFILGYPGVSLPSWFQPQNFPKLATLSFENCGGLESSALSFSRVSQNINLNETLDSNDAIIGTFSSLRELTLSGCGNIVSLNDFLDPASVPAIRKIKINDCRSLVSVPTGCLGDLHCLEELEVFNCPNIHSPHLVAPSLKRLMACGNSWNLAHNIERCSLTYFKFSSDSDTITLSGPALEELRISECRSLTSIGIGGIGAFPSLISLTVSGCAKLSTLDDFLTAEHLPAVKEILIETCPELLSLPSGDGALSSLISLTVSGCAKLSTLDDFLTGEHLPAVKEILIETCPELLSLPSGDGALSSLISLTVSGCAKLSTLDDFLTAEHLPAVKEILIEKCPELLSLPSGDGALSSLISLTVSGCAKLSTLDDFLTAEHLPAVEKILIAKCPELLSLPSERFARFHFLRDFEVKWCTRVNWQRGLVLPPSLESLSFENCGDISTVIPSCLQNLAFLVSLDISGCPGITSIPGNVWQSYLPSLKKLTIDFCPNLESIGGDEAIAKIDYVKVIFCPKIGDILRSDSSRSKS